METTNRETTNENAKNRKTQNQFLNTILLLNESVAE